MMRLSLRAAAFGAAIVWSATAQAEEFTSYFSCSTQISNSSGATTVYSSGIFHAPNSSYAAKDYAQAFKEYLNAQGLPAPYASCSNSETADKAFKWLDYAEEHALKRKARFEVAGWAPAVGKLVRRGEQPEPRKSATQKAETKPQAKPETEVADRTSPKESAADARRRQSEEVAARNRVKQAKYEADMKAWQDQIDAQKAEEERKKAEFERDKQQAAQRLASFASQQEAHRQEMEKAAEQLRNYQDAQRHHALCTAGDRSACEALAQGKLAEASVPKDAGEASTDDDARQCVTEPVLSPSEVWKGALKAVVVNGCAKPVDVRICLMRTGGWNCGMTLGLKPQEDWTWWTMNPQDGLFWDARTSGTNRKLASPQG